VRVLGVIPARGGSKGIPGKNIQPLVGTPLIVHTIECARCAQLLDAFVVSTDSRAIAAVVEAAGARVVWRPGELARDESPTEDALLHAVDELIAADGSEPEYVVTLEPTAPLRRPETIDACVRLALDRDADAVLTVVENRSSIGTMEDGIFTRLDPSEPRRRQLRRPRYVESSTVYVTRTAHLRRSRSVLAAPLYAVVVSEEEAIDINTPTDLVIAEALLRRRGDAAHGR
jgi:CMP-N,N'-diacetyllegionaminic acid synthase